MGDLFISFHRIGRLYFEYVVSRLNVTQSHLVIITEMPFSIIGQQAIFHFIGGSAVTQVAQIKHEIVIVAVQGQSVY